MVVYSEEQNLNPQKQRRRKIKKTLKIGVLGALNGVRMRPWFTHEVHTRLNIEDLHTVAERFGIPLERTPCVNNSRTIDLFTEADAKLGISLENPYIGERVFSVPEYGMVNIHHEVLPQFQGAQSIIWQLYEGSLETGYTIHKIDRHIDTGDILYQERMPIRLKPTLRETVVYNYARLYEVSDKGIAKVLKDFPQFTASAKPQTGGRSFTTPSFWQYLRMLRQHRRLYREQLKQQITRS
ncbi:MAG: hypothetical protein JOZ19_00940 [Rubrobacter sp.]|nr:hypothetical protein [Rubrobacter sp.]